MFNAILNRCKRQSGKTRAVVAVMICAGGLVLVVGGTSIPVHGGSENNEQCRDSYTKCTYTLNLANPCTLEDQATNNPCMNIVQQPIDNKTCQGVYSGYNCMTAAPMTCITYYAGKCDLNLVTGIPYCKVPPGAQLMSAVTATNCITSPPPP